MEKIAAEGKKAAAKVTQLQADLDHEAAVQQGREMELEWFRGESRERETLLKQLFDTRGELEKRSSELRKDSELQATSSDLRWKDFELQKKESRSSSRLGASWRRRANALR